MRIVDIASDDCSDQETVVLASYVRSGNTLSRGYIERITGILTGADGNMNSDLVRILSAMGFKAEGVTDKRVWIVKTHYPDSPGAVQYYAEKCILIVRNPLDSIPSLFNMICTNSHDKSIHSEDYIKF